MFLGGVLYVTPFCSVSTATRALSAMAFSNIGIFFSFSFFVGIPRTTATSSKMWVFFTLFSLKKSCFFLVCTTVCNFLWCFFFCCRWWFSSLYSYLVSDGPHLVLLFSSSLPIPTARLYSRIPRYLVWLSLYFVCRQFTLPVCCTQSHVALFVKVAVFFLCSCSNLLNTSSSLMSTSVVVHLVWR